LSALAYETLWELPVQRVDFVSADISQRQQRIIGSQADPASQAYRSWPFHIFQARHPFQLVIFNLHAIDSRLYLGRGVEVYTI
ncbi:MAG: hypothetical protein DMG96_38025, partial [Acidobacteria bacterium]